MFVKTELDGVISYEAGFSTICRFPNGSARVLLKSGQNGLLKPGTLVSVYTDNGVLVDTFRIKVDEPDPLDANAKPENDMAKSIGEAIAAKLQSGDGEGTMFVGQLPPGVGPEDVEKLLSEAFGTKPERH